MRINITKLYKPFKDSLLHTVCAVLAALLITIGLIFLTHSLSKTKPLTEGLSSSFDNTALENEIAKVSSDALQSEVAK